MDKAEFASQPLQSFRLRKKAYLALLLAAVAAVLLFNTHSHLPDSIQQHADMLPSSPISVSLNNEIPNYVHYVQLQKHERAKFHFEFKHFLSVYSSVVYLKPKTIFLHTDFSEEAIEKVLQSDNPRDKWTRRILSLKSVKVRHVRAPTVATGNGKKIVEIQHKSDFVRMDAVYEFGGLYMDFDVLPLRDITPLRRSGFKNIVGREHGGAINNGCWLSAPKTAMVDIFRSEANEIFDGGWTTHSCKLLTRVAERLVRTPSEVLIMDMLAFAPSSWVDKDVERLWAVHNESDIFPDDAVDFTIQDPYLRWNRRSKVAEWENDWSASYFLHSFDRHGKIPDEFRHGVHVKEVMYPRSNFGLLTYPVIKHAMEHGLVSEEDAEEGVKA
ncbi:hypothetical protein PV08_09523 [Exophiala spinifera]|uniref:Alpha 1,4-glycosyltransferase domain-containing protein n=1 Tax=Exophiala spinifera TaxID=91928 RepID=A0A0D1ZH28_9EURO|nr:uncharacterized protein PV08_09523 [Exophiala spinifera]KIW12247.1 hypothetical protein PV08_09523 [Exophiala spinifera]